MKGWLLHPSSLDATENVIKKMGVSEQLLMPVSADNVSFMIEDKPEPRFWIDGVSVKPPDFAILWSGLSAYGLSVAEQLESIGVICINPPSTLMKTRNKIVTGRILANLGIPVAKTIQLNKNTPREVVSDNLGFPLVVKPNTGFGGVGVTLIESLEEYASFLTEHREAVTEGAIIAQEYIASSKGKDLRVLVIDHNPVYAYVRQAADPDEFRSNLSVGGKSTPYELTDELKELSVKITKALDISMAGIDYLFTEKGVIVGEVNAAPGYSGLPNPGILIKSLTDCVTRQMMSRPGPGCKTRTN